VSGAPPVDEFEVVVGELDEFSGNSPVSVNPPVTCPPELVDNGLAVIVGPVSSSELPTSGKAPLPPQANPTLAAIPIKMHRTSIPTPFLI
jgi:hypothetical protein